VTFVRRGHNPGAGLPGIVCVQRDWRGARAVGSEQQGIPRPLMRTLVSSGIIPCRQIDTRFTVLLILLRDLIRIWLRTREEIIAGNLFLRWQLAPARNRKPARRRPTPAASFAGTGRISPVPAMESGVLEGRHCPRICRRSSSR
jgi:hypothetical protein